jgi:lipoprotein NlpD
VTEHHRQGWLVLSSVWAVSFVACVAARPAPAPPLELAAHPEPALVGVTHVVKAGETLWRLGKAYGVAPEEIIVANHLDDPTRLEVGKELFIPGAHAQVEVPAGEAPALPASSPASSEVKAPLAWPLIGVLYARFGPRGESRHEGVDIAAPEGTVVRCAGDGEVLYSAEQRGYGHVVIVQHAQGLVTLYAHNRENLVKEGARVRAGDPIARVGVASATSGPHLHFEVREKASPKDPLKYLPAPR